MHLFPQKLLIISILILFFTLEVQSQKNDTLNNISCNFYKIADKPLFTISGDSPSLGNKLKLLPMGIFVGGYGVLFYIQHLGQMKTIWKNRSGFHIVEDGKYALYSDKAGHFYGTFLSSYILSSSLIECGFTYNWSTALSALLGLGYTTYVEILDGFSQEWGFSPSDFYADAAGALFFLGFSYFPFLQNFTPKFMYFPPRWFNSKSRVPSKMFIDNYSAHTFWVSINFYNLLPESFKKKFPSWLELSIGYAVRNLCDPFHYNCNPNSSEPVSTYAWGNRKFIVAIDYDLVKLLPNGGPFWNWFKQSLNFIKLPSPAIEFGFPTRFYLLYPFPIRIGKVKF
ncbi:MAG: DUF2279 domain-containing protein [Candidatus Kapaibacteriales bacterium]